MDRTQIHEGPASHPFNDNRFVVLSDSQGWYIFQFNILGKHWMGWSITAEQIIGVVESGVVNGEVK